MQKVGVKIICKWNFSPFLKKLQSQKFEFHFRLKEKGVLKMLKPIFYPQKTNN